MTELLCLLLFTIVETLLVCFTDIMAQLLCFILFTIAEKLLVCEGRHCHSISLLSLSRVMTLGAPESWDTVIRSYLNMTLV